MKGLAMLGDGAQTATAQIALAIIPCSTDLNRNSAFNEDGRVPVPDRARSEIVRCWRLEVALMSLGRVPVSRLFPMSR